MAHTLPALGYAFEALEPHIDAQTMQIHHDRHHQAYVDNLNKAIAGTEAEAMSIEALMATISTQPMPVRNNGGGHFNHSLFWTVLKPNNGNGPTGKLAEAINNDLGGMDTFKEEFSKAAATRFGSGWAWLSVANGKLFISSTPNQDNPLMDLDGVQNGTPILGLDVWEHAYYLNYQNRRPDYISSFFSIINWDEVSRRYEAAL
jgi:Fe-Mn family superoxide dismutase